MEFVNSVVRMVCYIRKLINYLKLWTTVIITLSNKFIFWFVTFCASFEEAYMKQFSTDIKFRKKLSSDLSSLMCIS